MEEGHQPDEQPRDAEGTYSWPPAGTPPRPGWGPPAAAPVPPPPAPPFLTPPVPTLPASDPPASDPPVPTLPAPDAPASDPPAPDPPAPDPPAETWPPDPPFGWLQPPEPPASAWEDDYAAGDDGQEDYTGRDYTGRDYTGGDYTEEIPGGAWAGDPTRTLAVQSGNDAQWAPDRSPLQRPMTQLVGGAAVLALVLVVAAAGVFLLTNGPSRHPRANAASSSQTAGGAHGGSALTLAPATTTPATTAAPATTSPTTASPTTTAPTTTRPATPTSLATTAPPTATPLLTVKAWTVRTLPVILQIKDDLTQVNVDLQEPGDSAALASVSSNISADLQAAGGVVTPPDARVAEEWSQLLTDLGSADSALSAALQSGQPDPGASVQPAFTTADRDYNNLSFTLNQDEEAGGGNSQ